MVAFPQVDPLGHAVPAQVPVVLHDWMDAPEHCAWPGAQTPVQLPDTHVWFVHVAPLTQVPAELHVCGCVVDVHRVWLGAHATHNPFRHTGLEPEHAVSLTHAPLAQICGCDEPAHRTAPAEQVAPPLELDDDELPLDDPELDEVDPDELPPLDPDDPLEPLPLLELELLELDPELDPVEPSS